MVANIERKHVGGAGVNTGRKPTKTLVASAYAAHLARRGAAYGVVLDAPVPIDIQSVMRRSRQVTLDSRHGNEKWLEGMKTCTLIRGHARFEDKDVVRVGEDLLTAPQIFANVGARAAIPDFPGIQDMSCMTNSDMVMLDRTPEHLIIIGGSYIGLEFAQMHRRFGAEVTMIERGPHLVGREDEESSEAIRAILEAEGVRVVTGADDVSFTKHGQGVAVSVNGADMFGSDALIAVGRRPNTDDLGLDRAGVETDPRGSIKVDDHLSTNVEGIWALGNGKGAFTPTACNDFEIVAANLFDGADRRVSDRAPGYAL
jgi:pyruvate/2-oxoglutarate dehydrogenase complex dihydrolipoamide dehydrogenase (E3) component